MRLSLGQVQTQTQKQVQILAPRMIQSMEILQLPLAQLEERIEQELVENPLLEARQRDDEIPDQGEERENPDAPTTEEKELVVDEKSNNEDDFERLMELDRMAPDYFDGPTRSAARLAEDADRKQDAMLNVADNQHSLQDHLEMQLVELDVNESVAQLAIRIISALDTNGYLSGSLEDLLPPDADDQRRADLYQALSVVQSLEPLGVGARDLRECLLLQLTPDIDYYEELQLLIGHYLQEMAENKLPQIAKATELSIDVLQAAWGEVKQLNPKPGAVFSKGMAPIVRPDVFVERKSDGNYEVLVDENQGPQLRISRYYRRRLAAEDCTPEEREFIRRKVNAAQWLIEAINQRRSTLTKVTQSIVNHQKRFLDDGPEFIEPLKMQEVADEIGIHLTTVSRAVDDKWLQTPRGIFPLRGFFVAGTKDEEGEDVAWETIKLRLQEIIDEEDKANPYSDEGLVEQLKERGLNVARRTITKYRKRMNIPSSRQRKDWSKVNGKPN